MKRLIACAFLLIGAENLWADLKTVTLDLQIFPETPRTFFFHFVVDGQPVDLLCDDASGPLAFSWDAAVLTLSDDLSLTLLGRRGDPDAFDKYQRIAILEQLAYANPSFTADITEAIRQITDPTRSSQTPLTFLTWVYEQDPSKYDLSGFRILASSTFQEQTGYEPPVPEPSAVYLTATILVLLAWRSRSRIFSRK